MKKDKTPALIAFDMYPDDFGNLPKEVKWEDVSPDGNCHGVTLKSGGETALAAIRRMNIRNIVDGEGGWVIGETEAMDDWLSFCVGKVHRNPIVLLRIETLPHDEEDGEKVYGAWYVARWSKRNPTPTLRLLKTYWFYDYGGL